MDMAKVSSKGQVTIPVEIRKKLGLKAGDKFQEEMMGEAERAGITSEQDVVDIVREARRKLWEERHEGDV